MSEIPGTPDMEMGRARLLDGGSWWAFCEPKGGGEAPSYWKVVAWQLVDDAYEDGQEHLVAWINGHPPVRSDRFSEATSGSWIINSFVPEKPEGARTGAWS